MTSSIKPEVHNVSQRRLRMIEPRPEVTSAKVANTALQFRRYARGQNEGEHKETCALKHCALPHRGRSKDRSERTKQRCRVVYNADKRAFVYVCMYVCMCVCNIYYMRQTHTSNKKTQMPIHTTGVCANVRAVHNVHRQARLARVYAHTRAYQRSERHLTRNEMVRYCAPCRSNSHL